MFALAPTFASAPQPVNATRHIGRLFGILALSLLVACSGKPSANTAAPSGPVAGYEGFTDNGFYIEPVDASLLTPLQRRTEVDYAGDEPVGSIVVDTFARKLYHIQEGGRAMRYAIAVGREGLSFQGTGTIQRKQEWPSWQPTANMLATRPDLYAKYAGGREGGADNPLGSRAMYLYKGGRDTYFRIHGTIQNESIGRATSAGCIRLFNQDVIHLFEQVDLGTQVKVRSLPESLAAEGPFMDDAYGFAVPNTAENESLKAADDASIAEQAEAQAKADAKEAELAAKEAEKADKKRLRECKKNGIDAAICPALPKDESAEKKDEPFIGKPAISATAPAGAADTALDSSALDSSAQTVADNALAALDAADAKAEKKRLLDCKRKNIDPEICPPLKKK